MPKMNREERADFRRRLRQQDPRFGPLTEPTKREIDAADKEAEDPYMTVVKRAIDAQVEAVLNEGRKVG